MARIAPSARPALKSTGDMQISNYKDQTVLFVVCIAPGVLACRRAATYNGFWLSKHDSCCLLNALMMQQEVPLTNRTNKKKNEKEKGKRGGMPLSDLVPNRDAFK